MAAWPWGFPLAETKRNETSETLLFLSPSPAKILTLDISLSLLSVVDAHVTFLQQSVWVSFNGSDRRLPASLS